jgi:pyrroloquinoline quinone biosynthesis protein D
MAGRIALSERPRLVKRARLRFDALTRSYLLLSPERGLVLNESATAILRCCHGEQTVEQIARQLADGADLERVLADTLEFLSDLRARRLLEVDP